MQINRTTRDDVTVLAIDGRLDATTAPPFETALQAELQAGVTRLVIDLARVQLISSAALRVLVSAAKQMKKQGGQILVCALTPEVSKVFGISGLSSLFGLHPTLADALAALGIAASEPPPVAAGAPSDATEELLPSARDAAFASPAVEAVAPVAPPDRQAAPPEPLESFETPTVPPPVSRAPSALPASVTPPPPIKRMMPPPPPVVAPPPAERIPPPPPVRPFPASPAARVPLVDRPAIPTLYIIGAVVLILLMVAGIGGAVLFHALRSVNPPLSTSHASPTASATPVDNTTVPTPTVAVSRADGSNETTAITPTPGPTATATPEKAVDPSDETVSVPPDDPHRFDASSPENQQTRQAVLQRIDLMPILPAQRDRLYQAVDRAHAMGKIITISFATGRTDLGSAAIASLKTALQRPDIQAILNDPASVFVVLGFADSAGTPQTNKTTSERRAEKTVSALRGPCGMTNVTHAIGMGGSEFLDKENLGKNRVAEVWAVLP